MGLGEMSEARFISVEENKTVMKKSYLEKKEREREKHEHCVVWKNLVSSKRKKGFH